MRFGRGFHFLVGCGLGLVLYTGTRFSGPDVGVVPDKIVTALRQPEITSAIEHEATASPDRIPVTPAADAAAPTERIVGAAADPDVPPPASPGPDAGVVPDKIVTALRQSEVTSAIEREAIASPDRKPVAPAEADAPAPTERIVAAAADPDVAAPANPLLGALPAPNASDLDVQLTRDTFDDDCAIVEVCIDQYLWSLYQRTPKIDAHKVTETREVTIEKKVIEKKGTEKKGTEKKGTGKKGTEGKGIEKKGKVHTVTETVTETFVKIVSEDFTWKDFNAAERAGMSPMEFVIGGMDRSFKLRLYLALLAMDRAGLQPGITSGFRDDYRQALASGTRAASDSSFHGGSRRGGYGHGVAADLVSVKTGSERWAASEALWRWIDVNGKDYGIGRPYLDYDPPHVTPIDGQEYMWKRAGKGDWVAAFSDKKRQLLAKGDAQKSKSTGKIKPDDAKNITAALAIPAKVKTAQAGPTGAKPAKPKTTPTGPTTPGKTAKPKTAHTAETNTDATPAAKAVRVASKSK